ncbi:MAG: CCA tRNA nucleotidyltransferase [Desulfurococcales archaeon]|nr:CCA tRNA nucleotidyltransferase [Desulfurococcales archaeon]
MRGGVEEKVLEALRPTQFQLGMLTRLYNVVESRLAKCPEIAGVKGRVEAVGSFAKGTLLSDKWEIDVFLLLEGVDDSWIAEKAGDLLHTCLHGLPVISKYSQHPYVTLAVMGMEADIVPAKLISDPARARGVERTPFHTRWVKERITPWLADEVRLFKSFLKGIGVYGAETARGGFSGYLAEVLTIGYNGFHGVLEEASQWRPPVTVDPHGAGDPERLARRYRSSPLVIPDPVDPDRNVAAAVTIRSLATFILAARTYLEAPGEWYFHTHQPTLPPSLSAPAVAACLEGPMYTQPPQDVEGRLARLSSYMATKLGEAGFRVLHHGFSWDGGSRAVVYVLMESLTLPGVEAMQGPEAWSDMERVAKFIEKRLREGGSVWLSDSLLLGFRPRRILYALEALYKVLASAPLPRGARVSRSFTCPGAGCEGWCGREVERGADPTPAWIRLAYTPRRPRS